jgi:hypothetical protein
MASPPAPAKSSTLRIKKPPDPRFETGRVRNLTFPNDQHLPPLTRKRPLVSLVSLTVSLQLRGPEINSRLGYASERAICVTVPETSMHEDDLAPRPKNEIGTTW